MDTQSLILALISLVVAQQVFFMWQIQKLVNKVMSKSFYDYQISMTPQEPQTSYAAPRTEEMIEEFESAAQHVSSLV
jgi:hypothetical protein